MDRGSHFGPVGARRLNLFVGLFALGGAIGCNSESATSTAPTASPNSSTSSNSTPPDSPENSSATAREVLEAMSAAYANAKSYADSGAGRLRYTLNGEPADEGFDMAVTFVRPNKLRINAYNTMVVCDGEQFWAANGELQDQVVSYQAPAEITVDALHADPALFAMLRQQMAGFSPPLDFLLADKPLDLLLESGDEPTLLEPDQIDGRACDRVLFDRPIGRLVLWIDRQDRLLRRVEYPTIDLERRLADRGKVAGISLVVDFEGAQFDPKLTDEAFRFEVPEGARLVQQFVGPPPPEPSQLLGERLTAFSFNGLDGEPVTLESLSGKVAVIDFWATWCEPCLESLPALQSVYDKYKDNPQVAFLSVSVDETDVPDDTLESSFKQLGITVPIVRDSEKHAASVFRVEAIPNLFLIGPDGRVQDNEIGLNRNTADALSSRIERVLAGEDLFEERRKLYEAQVAAYEQIDRQQAPQQVPLAEKSDPAVIGLSLLWTLDEIEAPGNILPIEDDGAMRLIVNDGWHAVAEVSSDGKLIDRRELDLPQDEDVSEVVGFIRTAVDGQGRRYFAAAANASPRGKDQQLAIFDQEWTRVLAFPEGSHDGIADVQLADFDADGTLEAAVSYWGEVGVQGISLDGRRLWAERSIANVFSLALVGPNEFGHFGLACAHNDGKLLLLDHQGNRTGEISVADRFLRLIRTSPPDAEGRSLLVGLAPNADQTESVVGITPTGEELWNYPLPLGQHFQPIEMLTSGPLDDAGAIGWFIAAADGSIHILSAEGRPIDRFNHGATVTGIAATRIEGKPALILASPGTLAAWELTVPPPE